LLVLKVISEQFLSRGGIFAAAARQFKIELYAKRAKVARQEVMPIEGFFTG